MMELGAYWGYYSLWFASSVPEAMVYLVEPDSVNLQMGRRNFEINCLHADFTQAYIGSAQDKAENGVRIASLGSIVTEKALEHINILHADIQGFEFEMLQGALRQLDSRSIDYLFISTHSMDLHSLCADTLSACGYKLLVSVDLEESYSVDGILVVHSPLITPPVFEHPSRRAKTLVKRNQIPSRQASIL